MKATEFCYWLQGYFELSETPQPLTTARVEVIKNHLAMVFAHDIDPQAGNEAHQATLNSLHNPRPTWPRPPGPNGELMRC
jgi:hypothetical protein